MVLVRHLDEGALFVDDRSVREPGPPDAGDVAPGRRATPGEVVYEVAEGDAMTTLEDVQWADWGADGGPLVATHEGGLQARDGARPTLATAPQAELAAPAPDPAPAPAEAHAW